MKPPGQQAPRALLLRYRSIARTALARFGFERSRFSLIKCGENITWRVEPEGAAPLLLRIHRAVYHRPEEIASELEWLRAIRRSTGLSVPEPLETVSGEPFALVDDSGPHVCSMLRWTSGKHQWRVTSSRHLRALGRTMASLHAHALGWRRPEGFVRQVLDEKGLLSPESNWGRLPRDLPALFQEEDRPAVRDALERIGEVLRELDEQPGSRALIHADLHLGNVVFAAGEARPIDFDDAGFGYLAYDAASTLVPFHGTAHWQSMHDALFEGYSEVRTFPARQLALLPEFLVVRRLTMAIWLSLRQALIPRLPRDLAPYLASTAAICRRLSEGW